MARLPFSIRVLLESALRNLDEYVVEKKDVEALAQWSKETAGRGAATETPEGETVWIVDIPVAAEPEAMLRVAVTAQDSVYFIEAPVDWMWPARLGRQ